MIKEKFAPGIHNISNERYHASEGMSRSKLWTFKKLPSLYHYQYLSGKYVRNDDKEEYVIGNMMHTMLLEPELFDEQFYIMPRTDRRTNAGKELYAQAIIEAGNKTVITDMQLEQVKEMKESLLKNSLVSNILNGAKVEQSIFWEDKETGLLCKSRPDIWNTPLCGDLKTSRNASYHGFQKAAMTDGLFMQAAMMYEALQSIQMPFEKFIFICVEKTPPYVTGLYLLDDEALQFGLDLFHATLRDFAKSQEEDVWPDYGVQTLMIPKYATMENSYE